MLVRGGLSAFVLLLLGATAHADSLEPPPACPPGSRGQSTHEGLWCEPWTCSSDADCNGGRCVPWRVCTRVATVAPDRWGRRPPEPLTIVVGSCQPSHACTGTEEPPPPVVGSFDASASPTCTEATYCVPVALPQFPTRDVEEADEGPEGTVTGSAPESPAGPRATRNCGCATPAPSASEPIEAVALLALVLVVMGRRR